MNLDKVPEAVRAVNREGVDSITCGAIALWMHGIVRATEDADFLIAPNAENIERLKRALRSVWEDPSIDGINAGELLGDDPPIRYGPPDRDLHMDVLTRPGETYRCDELEWQFGEIEGVPIRIVTPAQLCRMKRDTLRPRGRGDAEALRQEFSLPEE
ncbi:MAG TPA: nucleotidyl transferase AbiEii/AbiGii toxin family protein [Thermoanaerobaculia bacterium]|nr:nucleotidyl transferase AbiEii/AbiGii toxin family protein [Thermoanaerobaculia bacterium]